MSEKQQQNMKEKRSDDECSLKFSCHALLRRPFFPQLLLPFIFSLLLFFSFFLFLFFSSLKP